MIRLATLFFKSKYQPWQKDLFCMLVDLTEDFAVSTAHSFFGSGVWLKPDQEVWSTRVWRKVCCQFCPREVRKLGIHQVRDVLKLIVCTDSADANLLTQDGLEDILDPLSRGIGLSDLPHQPTRFSA